MERLRNVFLAGLFALVPFSVSVWILFSLTRWLENILGPLFKHILKGVYIPGLGFIVLILIVLLVGYIASNFVGKRVLKYFSDLLEQVPLFNKLYLAVKGISDSVFNAQNQQLFESVVLVPFPYAGAQTIAFVTSTPKELGPDLVGVFVPNPPNPTNGFYIIYSKKDVKFLDMPVREGMKLVISVGISSRVKKDDETDKNS
jgi:uncharacterized membrane protein